MDLETFNFPSRSNGVPQSTLEIIDLDNYRLSGKRAIIEVIDLSDEEDDDIKILDFIPKSTSFGKRKRFEKGESSNSRNAPFVCEICTDTKTIGDAFYIGGCSHFYCSYCVAMYIGSKLDDNITNIGCPVPGCNGLLEPEFCRSILKPEVFERWGKALCEALIDVSEKFYCPFADCSALLINDGTEAVGNTKCPHCNRMFCAECKVPWHNGMECSEFEKLHADERGKEYDMLVNLAKKKNWQRCPKCRIYVARDRGCNVMSCRCGSTFCYKCGSSYSSRGCECFTVNPIYPVQQYEQIRSTAFPGVPIGGTFPFPYGYLNNTAQTYRQIPNIVSTGGVFTGGNVPNRNPPYRYTPQGQIYSGVSGGRVPTGGTPSSYWYAINSAQPQQHILNGVGYPVQQQVQIPSINSAQQRQHILNRGGYSVQQQLQIPSMVSSSTIRTLPQGYGTYPFRGTGRVSTPGTLSFGYPTITAQRHENIVKGVVYPTKRQG